MMMEPRGFLISVLFRRSQAALRNADRQAGDTLARRGYLAPGFVIVVAGLPKYGHQLAYSGHC